MQRAKKVVSDSLGLVDFAIGPVNSVLNLACKILDGCRVPECDNTRYQHFS